MEKQQNKFKEYLLNKFEDRFYKVMNSWLYENGEDFIDTGSYKTTSFKVIDIQDTSLYAGSKGDLVVEVDLNINPTIQYKNYLERGYYDVEEEIRKWLTLSFEYDINNDTIGFIDVDSYNPNRKKKPLNGDLVPIISRDEYENYANELLTKYYREALKGTPVNPYLLAQRMNIDIEEVDFNDDNTFAKIYLGEKGTRDKIILNIGLCDECSDAARYISITHECVHKFLHKMTYILYKKILSNNPEFNCSLDGSLFNGDLIMPEFLEIQANAIAPMVLMPRKPLLSNYLEVKNHNLLIYKNETDAIKETIEYLKGKYGVTKYAVKKRLFDLGVHEVKGISNYIDDNYVPDYYFKKDSLNYDEEFVIGFSDLIKTFCKTPNWYKLTNYIYVQGFLVLRNEKYVERDQLGNMKLTLYALSHVDECCVKFKVSKKISKNNHPFYQLGYLNRDNLQSYDYDHDIIVENKSLNDEETVDSLSDFCIDLSKTMKELAPLSWNKCIEYLMKTQGLTISSLSVNIGGSIDINKRTLARYVNGETKIPKKETLTAICLALNIPIMISNTIFNKGGIYLDPLSEYDNAILVTLTTLRGKNLEEINKLFLKMFGKTLI